MVGRAWWVTVSGLSLALSVAGCGGDDASAGGGGGGGGGAGGTVAGGGAGGTSGTGGSGGTGAGGAGGSGGGTTCAGPGYPNNDPDQTVDEVDAKIVDLAGNPAAGALVQLCGMKLCINGKADDQGVVVHCEGDPEICTPGLLSGKPDQRPSFKYGDGLGYVKFAQRLDPGQSTFDLGTVKTAKLPAYAEGAPIAAGTDSTSNGVTLSIAAGATVEIDTLTFETEEMQRFRAVEVPMAQAPAAVDPALGFEIVIGATPIETTFCPAAKLTVPNSAGWPAGTAVEFWIHGTSQTEGEWTPYADWAKVSDGAVSADGTSVVTSDGQGVPLLSVFGIKKKQ